MGEHCLMLCLNCKNMEWIAVEEIEDYILEHCGHRFGRVPDTYDEDWVERFENFFRKIMKWKETTVQTQP